MHDYYSNRLPSTFNNFFKSIHKVQHRLIVVVACEAQTYIFPVFASLQAIVVVVVIVFEEYFENRPYTCLQVLFFKPRIHTEFLVIIFARAENRSSTLVWETRGRLLSEVFERKADFFDTHIFWKKKRKKKKGFNASRVEKKSWNMLKITFSCSLRSKRFRES